MQKAGMNKGVTNVATIAQLRTDMHTHVGRQAPQGIRGAFLPSFSLKLSRTVANRTVAHWLHCPALASISYAWGQNACYLYFGYEWNALLHKVG